MSSLVSKILARPYFIFSFLAVFVSMGIYGYINIKRDLFPNSNRPEVALIVPSPSMSAKDIASTIVVPIEKELYTLEKVRRVYSSTNDEVSIIKVEFEYGKSMAEAI
ncbi:MAG: efflux RND transporter permease subunit, partial [Sulfurospirillum sp.]|nr:efflux RND transporter permease subunit [Sulfurospirillum sp.]